VHTAAAARSLDRLPPHLNSLKIFSIPQLDGDTPVHRAAANGSLDQLPQGLLTKEVFTTANNEGYNVYHLAALGGEDLNRHHGEGHLDQIPPNLITLDVLRTPNNKGESTFDLAARYDNLLQLPTNLLYEELSTWHGEQLERITWCLDKSGRRPNNEIIELLVNYEKNHYPEKYATPIFDPFEL
jgi:hypothetical protein